MIEKCINYLDPYLFIFTEQVPQLFYYVHIPTIFLSLVVAVFILLKGRQNISAPKFFMLNVFFVSWVFINMITWTNNNPEIIFFVWSLFGLVQVCISILSLYFIYVFLENKEPSFRYFVYSFILILPVVIFLPTDFNLSTFDMELCGVGSYEGKYYLNYYYFISFIFYAWLIYYLFKKNFNSKDISEKLKISSTGTGIFLFLTSFFVTGYVASSTGIFELEQFGIATMPIFLSYILFTIVKFKTFNIKLLVPQVLVFSLIFLNFAILFIKKIENVRVVMAFTIIVSLILGYIIIKSVKKVDQQREALDLVNIQQTNLLHFISHQVKGFFTKSRNAFSGLLEGDYGPLPETARKIVQEGFDSDNRGVETVQQILNAANLKTGTTTYSMTDTNLINLIKDKVLLLKSNAEKKNLTLNFNSSAQNILIKADSSQLGEALKNLIDNSIRYTPAGKIDITVEQTLADKNLTKSNLADKNPSDKKVIIKISDTGIGISADDIKNLFREGGRGKESIKVNVDSTGYGLYIVKNIVEAHGGTVSVFSAGAGLGSTFTVVLPVK